MVGVGAWGCETGKGPLHAPYHTRAIPKGEEAIPAALVPAHTTPDPNVNGNVETVRCPVPDGGKEGLLGVVFLLQDPPLEEGGEPPEPYALVRVEVPRATRTAGHFSYVYVNVHARWIAAGRQTPTIMMSK